MAKSDEETQVGTNLPQQLEKIQRNKKIPDPIII